MDFCSIIDSHGPEYQFSTELEEPSDFGFPMTSELSDIDNWVSSDQETCCSNDFRGLSPPVQGYASSSVVIQSRASSDTNSAANTHLSLAPGPKLSNSCPSSPREYGLPEYSGSYSPVLLSCPPSWLELRPQLEDEVAEVPLSSSSPEFNSSSPTSDISSELGKEEGSSSLTSASSGRSDTASISSPRHSDCGQHQDQFSQRLHDLLVLVLRGRELERSRTQETDCTTCTSRSDDSEHGSDNQALKKTKYIIFAHIYALALFWN